MTEIERKALALVNEACKSEFKDLDLTYRNNILDALLLAIEQHEAFRREVSDAVEDYCGYVPPDSPCHPITRFIIAKPDPLVEVMKDAGLDPRYDTRIRAAIEARGGRIVWEGE